jgi:cellulose synthase/poly-beta-1,6-N-acetylglucosamine synthase-like glycosyltransferase
MIWHRKPKAVYLQSVFVTRFGPRAVARALIVCSSPVTVMATALIIILFAVVLLFVIAQIRIVALVGAAMVRTRAPRAAPGESAGELPSVTVQLPIYRETDVLQRLLVTMAALDYPEDRFGIQVLDDSEEPQAAFARAMVESFASEPVMIEYVNRGSRAGYKSGALNHGLGLIDSDLVAVFDADFLPDPEFLRQTVTRFDAADVAAVHTRWRHRNATSSSLTMMQASILDSLFCFQNTTRGGAGQSGMYLGTSGVWRRSAIVDLGGWRERPFTDDGIDLSFRAMINGWSIAFIEQPLASSDLPGTYIAYKQQQRRWACAALRLLFDYGRVALRPPGSTRPRFLELSSMHLVLSTPALLLAGLTTGVYVVMGLPRSSGWLVAQAGLAASLLLFPPAQECMLSQRLLYADWGSRCRRLLGALPLAIGVSISIAAGFLDTLRGGEREFVRTPKGHLSGVMAGSSTRWRDSVVRVALAELLAGVLLLSATVVAVALDYLESCALLVILASGYLIASARSWREIRRADRERSRG